MFRNESNLESSDETNPTGIARAKMSFIIKLRCQCGHEFKGPVNQVPPYCSQCGKRLTYGGGSIGLREFPNDRVRARFVDMIKAEFYCFLEELTDSRYTDYVDVLKVGNEIVNAKTEEINNYLRNHEIEALDTDKHVNVIIQRILIPYALKIEREIRTLKREKRMSS